MALRPRRTPARALVPLLAVGLAAGLVTGVGAAAQAGSQDASPRYAEPTLSAAELTGTPRPGYGWIVGTVVDADGLPVENARVEAHDYWEEIEGPIASGLTYGGEFRLYGLRAEYYQLKISTGPGSAHPLRTTWVGREDGIRLRGRQILELKPATVAYQKVDSTTTTKAVKAKVGNRAKARITARVVGGAPSTLVPAGSVTYRIRDGKKVVGSGSAALRDGVASIRTARLAGPPKATCTKAQKRKRACPRQVKQRRYTVEVSYRGSDRFAASAARPLTLTVTFAR